MEIDLSDPELLRDPFTAYGEVRERSAVARLAAPGFGPLWGVLRHREARAMLADPRFELSSSSYLRPDVPEHCLKYMRTMGEIEGAEHARLRRLVSPGFTVRNAEEFRPRIAPLVDRLLDGLTGEVDLLATFARPLPMDVICELVGISEADRPRWREYGAAVAVGFGQGFADAIPHFMADAEAAVAYRREEPGDDLLSDLLRLHDRPSDDELVTLVWHLVLAGQTPTNLIANAIEALLRDPSQLEALRADPKLLAPAVDELTRWCAPQLLTVPRYAQEDVEVGGVLIRKGEAATAVIASVNRDPRVFADADRLDVTRGAGAAGHLAYGHGPHFCLGFAFARVQVEMALALLLQRFSGLRLVSATRLPDPGTWRLANLTVVLGDAVQR